MSRIEDYALVGDTHTAALVSLDGSIDWCCLPRFDSEACFAALLDDEVGGRWRIAPAGDSSSSRHYRDGTMILETSFETDDGTVELVDLMPVDEETDPDNPRGIESLHTLLRVVCGVEGRVDMEMEFTPRFDYGRTVPWTHVEQGHPVATAGADALDLWTTVELSPERSSITARWTAEKGKTYPFVVTYRPSYLPPKDEIRAEDWKWLLDTTERFWKEWSGKCAYEGRWHEEIVRSLLTLKALTFSPSGGIVAAATTSLPERLRGVRNWDYRYCWLRDATLALEVLIDNGYRGEAEEWHDWLQRATFGEPHELQMMYSITGERWLPEFVIGWLGGYERSHPVRIGNAATEQFQLDVFGEVMDLFHAARCAGIDPKSTWRLQVELADFVAKRWSEPDNGLWEVRGPRRHYVHSKVMAWVALDRAAHGVEDFGLPGDAVRWRNVAKEIEAEVHERGFDTDRGTFVISYGSEEVDAGLLRLPLVGFIEASDDRMRGTVAAIEKDLLEKGLVRRYRSGSFDDGLPPGEGAFFLCTFWYVSCLVLLGREPEAEKIFEHAVGLANDVGLFSEQYSVRKRRQVGNFPQAFSHFAMVTAALTLEQGEDAPSFVRDRG